MRLVKLVLNNFKSFKNATLSFSPHLTAIVGPNGSGKSNVCDGIRFVLGEKRLKSLRAKKAKDLIFHGSSSAYVEAVFSSEEGDVVIRRSINNQGKVSYRLNGKVVSLSTLKEFLRRHGIRGIDTFIIPQGEITRIALMNSKEKRAFIDEISGVAEFEAKKKEAMRELEVVEGRIKEFNIIMGEKLKYLDELKREKEIAEEYERLKKRLDNIKATLLHRQVERLEERKAKLEKEKGVLEERLSKAKEEAEKVREELEQIFKDRQLLDKEIEAKTKRSEIYRRMESLKTNKAVMEERKRSVEESLKRIRDELATVEKNLEDLEALEKNLKEELANAERESKGIKIKKVTQKRKSLELRAKLDVVKEKLSKLISDIEVIKEKISHADVVKKHKEAMLKGLSYERVDDKELRKELSEIEKKLRESFGREKSLNNKIAAIDKEIIKIREKLATLRASAGSTKVNPIYVFLSDLASSGKLNGFYGRVIDLIEFDEKYANAVEAAGGNRLTYFVVESLDVAKEAIKYLKKMNLGRATFIPLRELNVPSYTSDKLLVKTLVSSKVGEKLLDFVFGDTIVVESFSKAKPLIGKHRIVTLDGELFEKTAVVSGGRGKSSIVVKKAIEQLEKELSAKSEERKQLISSLSSFREELSNLRARKSYIEKKLAELEKTIKEIRDKEAKRAELEEELKKLEEERKRLVELLGELEEKKLGLEEEKKALEEQLKEALAFEEKLFGEELEEREKLIKKKVSLEERIKSLREKLSTIAEERKKLYSSLSSLRAQEEKKKKELSSYEDELRIIDAELTQLEEEFALKEEEIRELMKKSKEVEERIRELSAKEAKANDEISRMEKSISRIDVELAEIKGRLTSLKEELEKYTYVVIEGDEATLSEELKALERRIAEMGNINFAAKELYYKVYDEVGEIKEKLEKLKVEKDKIIELMAEIDEKKKFSFMSYFNAVNRHFKSLSAHIKGFGEAYLELENKEDPFEGGLTMKVIRDGKEIPLQILSGGEQTLLALMFLFALQFAKPSPLYVLDEVDAALDKLNAQRMGELIRSLSRKSQFIVISHNDITISHADAAIGISKVGNTSKALHLDVRALA